MNILYVNGHPYDKSFHTAIEKTFVDALSDKHTVEILSLGKADFDPILRFGYSKRMAEDTFIKRSQELVVWADHIVFAFPIWWGSAPALFTGWIDRVFTPGLMYKFEGPKISQLLKGRTSDIIITSRSIKPIFWLTGNFGVQIMLRNVFTLTGVRKKKLIRLGGIGFIPLTDNLKRREAFLARVKRRASSL